MVFYFIVVLIVALKRIGIGGNIIPENIDGSLNYSIANYLKKLKNISKMEIDRFTYSFSSVSSSNPSSMTSSSSSGGSSGPGSSATSNTVSTPTPSFNFHQLLEKGYDSLSH